MQRHPHTWELNAWKQRGRTESSRGSSRIAIQLARISPSGGSAR